MSLFDTLVLDPTFTCSVCGKTHTTLQTHSLGDSFATYRKGSFIRCCPVHYGILREALYCRHEGTDEAPKQEVWLVLWHGIYAGHAPDEESAKAALAKVDRLDLIRWLEAAQSDAQSWQSRYRRLFRDLDDWKDVRDNPPVPPIEGQRAPWNFRQLPDEVWQDADPLSRIIERNALSAEEEKASVRDSWGW